MNAVGQPQVGDWYRDTEKDETFQVVSLDASSGTIEVQSFDGELDSIDTDDWGELPLVAAPEPEDWTGAMEDVEPDDVTQDDSPSDRA